MGKIIKRKHLPQQTIKIMLICLAAICALMHITVTIYGQVLPHGSFIRLVPIFDLDREVNVPAAYTGMLLGAGAVISCILASKEKVKSYGVTWFALAGFLLYLGFDEIISIHEKVAEPVRKLLNIDSVSILYHAWVVPVIVVAAIAGMALYFVRNSRKLLSAEQKKILGTLLILIIVDAILESIGTRFYGSQLVYKLGPVFVEEMFEISMISLILYQLICSLEQKRSR